MELSNLMETEQSGGEKMKLPEGKQKTDIGFLLLIPFILSDRHEQGSYSKSTLSETGKAANDWLTSVFPTN